MHKKQIFILKKLEKKNGQKFSELGKLFDYNDKFPYHLQQLLKKECLIKENNMYYITHSGALISMKHNTQTLAEQRFKSVLINLLCQIDGKYILKTKTYNNVNYLFLPRIKFTQGMSTKEACDQLLQEMIGVNESTYTFLSTHIRKQFASTDELLFDNIFLIYETNLVQPNTTLKLGNNYVLLSKEELLTHKSTTKEIELIFSNNKNSPLQEYSFKCDYGLKLAKSN